jgi:endonuclease YncB( thermonuclease family)
MGPYVGPTTQSFKARVTGCTAILARKCGRESYGRIVIQAWLLEDELNITSLSYLAVISGWARYAPYEKRDVPDDVQKTAQLDEVMREAERTAEKNKAGMYSYDNAPTRLEIEQWRRRKRLPENRESTDVQEKNA